MVQALFALVFVSICLPVLIELVRNGDKCEASLVRFGTAGRIVTSLFLAGIGAAGARLLPADSFLFIQSIYSAVFGYLIQVPIHETGHFIFMPLGETMCILGGSLTEFLLPALFAGYFLMRQYSYLGSIFLFITGSHLVHIAEYMSSAHDPKSILLLSLEQTPETHDWYQLFSRAGLLESDTIIAWYVRLAGLFVMVLALVFLFVIAGDHDSEISPTSPAT